MMNGTWEYFKVTELVSLLAAINDPKVLSLAPHFPSCSLPTGEK